MKKLFLSLIIVGLANFVFISGANAQMMSADHNMMNNSDPNASMPGHNSDLQMHKNYMNESYAMPMMQEFEDSLYGQYHSIVAAYDSLQSDFERIRHITNTVALKQAMRNHNEMMLALQDRLSRLENTETRMEMRLNTQRILHSLHNAFHAFFGINNAGLASQAKAESPRL